MNKIQLYSLEYYISLGCINCCVGCSHGAPIRLGLIDVEVFKRDIENAKKVIEVHRFALSGGEPLLHPKVEELVYIAKTSGIAKEVMVLTNGLLLDKMSESFWKQLDILRISRYPGQLSDNQIELYKKRAESYGAEFMVLDLTKFYLPILKILSNQDETISKFRSCPYYNKCSAIYDGWYYQCSQASFFPEIMKLNTKIDGIQLESLNFEKLKKLMERKRPLESCRMCSYNCEVDWKQTTKEKWLEDSSI